MKLKKFLELLKEHIDFGNGTDMIQGFGIQVAAIQLSEYKPRGWVFLTPHPVEGHYLEIEDAYSYLTDQLEKGIAKEDDIILIHSGIANKEVEANQIIHNFGYLNLTNSHATN